MEPEIELRAGPVADRLTLWPVDDGRYGLDAVFQGASGYDRCEEHRGALEAAAVNCARSSKAWTAAGRCAWAR